MISGGVAAGKPLSEAIVTEDDYIGVFELTTTSVGIVVDAWSNIILDDEGSPRFRLVALARTEAREESQQAELEKQVLAKDLLLRELQHRVKNNLQMITALIRLEARSVSDHEVRPRFDRLAGRVGALAMLYRSLEAGATESVDLGVYLSQIASAIMEAHAIEGIRLDLKVDAWPVSVESLCLRGLSLMSY